MKCTWPTPAFCIGTQHNLYSTDWLRGLSSGKTQILGLASGVRQILALGNAKIYQHVGISNAKFWRRGHYPTPTPDARYFASQWNIGSSLISGSMGCPRTFTLTYNCTINVNTLCHILLLYTNHGGPRIVLLRVHNCNVHYDIIMYWYLYTCTSPFGADRLINEINLFHSTGVTESLSQNPWFKPRLR